MRVSTWGLFYLLFMIIVLFMGIFMGIIMGIERGQFILFEGMDGVFRDANIIIDINETHIIEAFRDEFIPIFNQTLQENMKNE